MTGRECAIDVNPTAARTAKNIFIMKSPMQKFKRLGDLKSIEGDDTVMKCLELNWTLMPVANKNSLNGEFVCHCKMMKSMANDDCFFCWNLSELQKLLASFYF